MKKYDANKEWLETFTKSSIAYPPEPLIRILLGKFPDLSFFSQDYNGKSVVDLGYGDGRNFPLFQRLGLRISGMEISDEIIKISSNNPEFQDMELTLRAGRMASIPFNQAFDYVISWNSCYYMDAADSDFSQHSQEMLRLCKPGGFLIISIPQKNSFIYRNAHNLGNGNVEITNDYFGVRNGQVMRRFLNVEDFLSYFKDYVSGSSVANLNSEWFGLSYDWDVIVMQKI